MDEAKTSTLLLIIGIITLMFGLHNIDNAMNLLNTNYILQKNGINALFYENSLIIKNQDYSRVYVNGVMLVMCGMCLLIASALTKE